VRPRARPPGAPTARWNTYFVEVRSTLPSPEATTHARLFLALWPAPSERALLVDHLQQWSWPKGASLVAHDRLHLTLHFIGSLERARLTEVSAALQVPVQPFRLLLTRAEVWPHGVAVLRATTIPEQLTRLRAHLSQALGELKLPLETRRWRPHVTLARRATGAVVPLDSQPLCWWVGGYVLVESLIGGAGGYRLQRHYD